MRRVSRILLALSMGVGAANLAEARERLIMPFDCRLEGGHIKLSPAPERSYPIASQREEQVVTFCRPPLSIGCRTIMVHRFAISCGGVRVAWMSVAGAVTGAAARSWIEVDRLNLVLPAREAPSAKPSCFDHQGNPRVDAVLERRVVLAGDCLPWRRRADLDHLVLPPGFAPIGELGARLLLSGPAEDPPSAPAAESEPQSLLKVSAGPGETIVARADLGMLARPVADPVTERVGLTQASNDWVTVVRSEGDYGTETSAPWAHASAWQWLLASLAVAMTAVLVRAGSSLHWNMRLNAHFPQLSDFVGRWRADFRPSWDGGDLDPNLANGGEAVGALLDQTVSAVSGLKGARPLREVLLEELKLVRQRLSSVMALAAEDKEAAAKAAPQFRTLIREIMRIRRIADSAAASLSRGRGAAVLPKTASEAYDVLGVNPDVSDSVLKKIVDALRMSWHPDHARDEADRLVREDRIRQINIACELISGKRDPA